MLGAKLIIKPKKKGELRERSPSYADFLPSIIMVTGLRIFMISQATTCNKSGFGFRVKKQVKKVTHFYNDNQYFISLYMKRREVSY